MPRYFFDVTVNGTGEPDQEGVLFMEPAVARLEAYRVASEIAAEPNGPTKDVLIGIRDETGRYFCEVELHITVRDLS